MIILGDAANVLKDFNDCCIDCVITSPPYWGLRDYKTEGQLGLEPTFQEYINKLIAIFDDIKRVLKKEGTCWIVLGDTYSNKPVGNWNGGGKEFARPSHKFSVRSGGIVDKTQSGILEKSLLMIPQRFAIAMLDKGWILRNDIIWYKPNCMPSSATDRFTVDYEHIFFFTKSQKYYFKTQYEQYNWGTESRYRRSVFGGVNNKNEQGSFNYKKERNLEPNPLGRIKRTVWKIATKPYPEAHFAVFPEELIRTPILAGCPEGEIVLDPFAGSGTTLKAAHQLGRKWVGIEINPDYVQLAKKRLTPYIQQQRLDQFTIAERNPNPFQVPSLP